MARLTHNGCKPFLTSRKWTQIAKNHHRHRGPKSFAGGSPCTFGRWGPHRRATHLACTTQASTLSGHPGPVPPVPPLRVFYYPPDDFPGPQVRYLFAKSIAIEGIDGVGVEFWVRVATGPAYAPPRTFWTCPGGGGFTGFQRELGGGPRQPGWGERRGPREHPGERVGAKGEGQG